MKINISDAVKRVASKTMEANFVDSLDRARSEAFNEALKFTAERNNGKADVLTSLRMLLLSDQELFDDVSSIMETRKGGDSMRKTYERFAKVDANGKTRFQRAIDADAGAGDSDLATLFVEKTIKKRVEAESEILAYCDVRRLSAKSGKFPKSSNLAKCAFAAASADLADLTSTIDGGLDQTAVESEKFGATMFLEAEVYAKFDAQVVAQLLDELTFAYSRGMRDQIYAGNGTPPNATGIATGATAITYGANLTETVIKMLANVADVSKGGTNDLFIVTNTAGALTFHTEKLINPAYNDLLDVLGGNFLKRLPIIEDNVIVTSGSSPAKTAPLYVGKKGDYLVAINQEPQVVIDQYSDFKAGGTTARIMSFWTGKPHFADSFAKTTIPAIY
jgi:HK97 family phage major capsid protein